MEFEEETRLRRSLVLEFGVLFLDYHTLKNFRKELVERSRLRM